MSYYNKKRTPRNEFRYNYKYKHPQYVFEEEGKKYHSLGITHHPYTDGRRNMPLDCNPRKNHFEKSYIRYGVITDLKDRYSGIDTRYKFSSSDFPKVKSKIRSYKSRRRYR